MCEDESTEKFLKELALAVPSSQFQRARYSFARKRGSVLMSTQWLPSKYSAKKEWQKVFNNAPAHFHMDYHDTSYCKMTEEENTLKIFMMEDLLWELPIIGRGIDFVDGVDRNVIFANDVT